MTFAGLFQRAAPQALKHPRKVAVLGAAGGIGQPLSLLLKLNPLVSSLSLYDIANTPGVAADVSHVNTRAQACRTSSLSRSRSLVFCLEIVRTKLDSIGLVPSAVASFPDRPSRGAL
jgi:hypothetical protein